MFIFFLPFPHHHQYDNTTTMNNNNSLHLKDICTQLYILVFYKMESQTNVFLSESAQIISGCYGRLVSMMDTLSYY